jgi:cell division protein FtsW
MVYSSTMILSKEKYGDSFFFFKKQVIFLAVGLFLMTIVALFKYPIYLNRKLVIFIMLFVIAGLIMVFLTGKINYSYRWIKFAGVSIQPSEFAKIAVVLYMALILGKSDQDVNNIRKLFVLLLPVLGIELLILKEPDYGSFFLILLIVFILLFISGMKFRYIFSSLAVLIPFSVIAIVLNADRFKRVLAFLNPEQYYTGVGYQAAQSIYAVGSGGIFGQGLGNSTQKLYFLPYAYTDFIFSIIAEEIGLIGALLILVLFFVFLIRGLAIAKFSGNRHTYLLISGLTFLIVAQAFINISVTIGLFPTKGIPLPFISIGGSSLIATLLICGIIINVSKHRKMVLLNE